MAQDSNTLLQMLLKQQGLHTTRPQFTNVLYGTILQTDVSIAPSVPAGATSPIPPGMMTVSIPSLGDNYVTDPILYPHAVTPPVGSQVAIGFTPNGIPVCVTAYKFGVLPISDGGTGANNATDALTNLGGASDASVAAETARAEAAESALSSSISAETSRAEAAESAETTRAEQAESDLASMMIMGAYY